MYTIIKHLHSGLAYLLLIGLLVSIVTILLAYLRKKPFTDSLRKVSLLGLVSVHLQLLVGIAIYFISPLGFSNATGAAMKEAHFRFYMLEHPLIMLLAVILITVGYARAKRLKLDHQRYRSILLFYPLGLLLILSRIPWQAWLN